MPLIVSLIYMSIDPGVCNPTNAAAIIALKPWSRRPAHTLRTDDNSPSQKDRETGAVPHAQPFHSLALDVVLIFLSTSLTPSEPTSHQSKYLI